MKSSASWTIGELAQRFGLATHVLRHWESMGLLTPAVMGGAAPLRPGKELIEHAMDCPLPLDECAHARERIEARIPPP